MKCFVIILVLALLTGCGSDDSVMPPNRDVSNWVLKSNTMNVGILVFNYLDYTFEGGVLSYYPPCANCAPDSIPAIMTYHSPGDVGDVRFVYPVNNETLFFATIIWMGTGHIVIPDSFLARSEFSTLVGSAGQPQKRELYISCCDSELQEHSDTCWARARTLDIVHEFSRHGDYQVALYMYAPRRGMFDPSLAKWIVFLFCQPSVLAN